MRIYRDVVDVDTGECFQAAEIWTKEDVENREKQKENYKHRLAREEYQQSVKKDNGAFVWLLYNVGAVLDFGISPATLTRLIYISTFIENDNKLWIDKDHGISMTEVNMKALLGLSRCTYERFVQEVTENNILIKQGECFYINDAFLTRGKLPRQKLKKSLDKRYMKIYNKAIRKLYAQAKVSEHSKIAYLYQMIPFVNIHYNILCHNPKEEDKSLIKAMTMEEYCELIGYSADNARRLKTQLKKITINKVPVLNFVENLYGLFCYVNPRVFFGDKPEKLKEVEILGEFKK